VLKAAPKALFLAAAISLLFSGFAEAQNYPWPRPVGSANDAYLCQGCPGPLPTFPYSIPPMKGFAGRYLDSQATRDFQTPLRTLRARNIRLAPERDRVYMIMGSMLAGYKMSTFFGGRLGTPVLPEPYARNGGVNEQYLPPDGTFYPERDGWQTVIQDGQDRLSGIEYDDRGNVYLATGVFGWGIVHDDNASFSKVSQVVNSGSGGPGLVVVLKGGAKYYALTFSGTAGKMFDVTTATTPVALGPAPFGASNVARTDDYRYGATANYSTSAYIFDATSSVLNPRFTVTSNTTNGVIAYASTDGQNFYFLDRAGNGGTSRVRVVNPATGADIVSYDVPNGNAFRPEGIHAGQNHFALWGPDNSGYPAAHLYKIQGTGLLDMGLTDYLHKYYNDVPAGYAKPDGYIAIRDLAFTQFGGKNYFFYASDGLGDVYEVQDGDSISIDLNRSLGFGTTNPNSPTAGQGPYYGDILRFSSSGTGQASTATVNWTFGNPEAFDNSLTLRTIGTTVSHQYSGITSASAITTPKQVKATGALDTSLTASLIVSLLTPTPRVVLAATASAVSSGQSTTPIVPGDLFVDASDGSVESHYDVWTLDGVDSTKVTPTDSQPVGTCGAHTLSFAANYVPYTGTAPSITPQSSTSPYLASVAGIAYSVKPFAAKIAIQSSSSTAIVFKYAGRTASSAAFTSGATWDITWDLLDSANTVVQTQATTAQPVGTVPSFQIAKGGTGSKVRLTLSMLSTSIVDSSCATLNSDSSTYLLVSPAVSVSISPTAGCSALSPCSFTAVPATGAVETGWTYQWKLDGAAVSGATAKTYSYTFPAAGTHTVSVDVTNPIGTTTATTPVDVAVQSCSPFGSAQLGLSISSTSVTSGTPISFNASFYFYTPQACDVFSWTFGDGQTSSLQTVDHTYASDGTYSVRLTVSHPDGTSKSASNTVTVGSPPPPPPTGCPTSAPSDRTVFINYAGTSSGCNTTTNCATSETIVFQPQAYGYTFQTCDTFLWSFGDGGTSTLKSPSHFYTAAGTFTVRLTVTNSFGKGSTSTPITIGGSAPPPTGGCSVPGVTAAASVGYSGASSQCSAGQGSPNCSKNENVTFTASIFGYTLQSCDTFAWTFGDGATSTLPSPVHQFAADGPYNVALTISTSGNKTLTAQSALRVSPNGSGGTAVPVVTMVPSVTTASVNAVITFVATATPADGVTWTWNFGDGSIQTGQATIQHAYTAAGSYDVQVKASNSGGSSAPAISRIIITPGAAFSFIIPVVGHFNGNHDTKWRSDVQIFNPSNEAMTLTFEFKGARGFKRDVVIDSSTRVYEDVLKTMAPYLFVDTPGCTAGSDISCGEAGPMIISGTSSKTPQIWSRTYTVSQTGVGTFGQQIPAVPIDGSQVLGTQPVSYVIAGVENSSRFRTNLGLVNPSASPLTVTISATDAQYGGALGGDFSVTIPAYQFTQIGDLGSRIDAKNKPYSLRVTPSTNSPVVAYGSMIDNISNDPVYIPGTADSAQSSSDFKVQFVPGVGHLLQANGTWRSDVTVFNPDSKGIMFTARYYDSTGAKVAEVADQPLASNTFIRVDDIVRWPLFATQPADSFGVLTIDTTSASVGKYPIVTSRTYKDRGELGSYGQGIVGTSMVRANVKPGKPAYIAGVRSDPAYYTNLGLISLGTKPTDVLVSLLDKTTGQVVGTWHRTYDADGKPNPLFSGESLIARDILRALSPTADSGTLKIEIVGDGDPVWAYASIIDQTTSDPEYVAAVPLN